MQLHLLHLRTAPLLLQPAAKHDDGAARGGQLLPQLGDEEGVVGQSLLHRQQAHLGDVEGRVPKGQGLAVVPLDKRQGLEEVRRRLSPSPASANHSPAAVLEQVS